MSVGIVDARFGAVLDVHRQRLGDREPRWWLCTTSLARYPIGSPFNESPPTSAGTSIDAEQALRRAVGEALERYSALTVEIPLERASLRETGLLGRLPVCAPDEPCAWSFRSPPEDELVTQTPVRNLATGETMLLPAALVSLAFAPQSPEPPVAVPISTGLAFHPRLHEAIWRGLCEVVERDAVMTMWWLHRAVPEIEIGAACPDRLADRLERLRARGLHARFYDITTEIEIPTVFCVLTGEHFPQLVVSAATRAAPEDACAKALDEVVSMRIALQAKAGDVSRATDGAPTGLVEHAQLYANGEHAAAFDFLLGDEHPRRSYSDFAARACSAPEDMRAIATVATSLADEGLTPLWADVTAPDVAELGFVARVVVPELVPLSPDDGIRWLGTPRLLRRAGITTATRDAFSPYPHPFA